MKKKYVKVFILLLLSSFLQAFALKNFYQSSGLLSGGVTGIGLIIDNLTNGAISLSTVLVVMNIPLAIHAFFNVGRIFTILSFFNVFITSIILSIMPEVVSFDDLMLSGIYGGIIHGLGVSLALEAGASTGGTDFIALHISQKKQVSAGPYMMMLNGIIVLISGKIFGWEIAAYTMISLFVSTKVIDSIHVRYQRVTLSIITSKGDDLADVLLKNGLHGITIIDAYGAYTKQNRKLLYMVISSYELTSVKEMIFEYDRNAFVNVTSSSKIFGNFITPKYK